MQVLLQGPLKLLVGQSLMGDGGVKTVGKDGWRCEFLMSIPAVDP